MSYIIAVMQTRLSNIAQICTTFIGLVLLAVALVLNHQHPHNEGIANINHGSIAVYEQSSAK